MKTEWSTSWTSQIQNFYREMKQADAETHVLGMCNMIRQTNKSKYS